MLFIVHTQFLENYGAFEGSGKFSEGESRWKYKFGNTYVVMVLTGKQMLLHLLWQPLVRTM